MRTTFSAAAALVAISGASAASSVYVPYIPVAAPSDVFALPVVYATVAGAAPVTATTLAVAATASSDAKATDVFDSAADVSAALSSAASAKPTAISRIKRDTCVAQPLGIKYNSVPDTAVAFAADGYYAAQALAASTPSGYTLTMSNQNASNSADQYFGYTLMPSYDVASCLKQCSAIDGCNSVNIYFERSPTVNPDNAACLNPASTIDIKCVFWGGAVTADNANNFGQWRGSFQVLIAGSNGYMNSTYVAKLAAIAAAAPTTSALPATATDAASNIYTFYYSSDSTTGAYGNAQAASSYTDCMTACDADSQCNAFTYVGATNGAGAGTCWLKASLGSPSKSGNNVISGTRSGKATKSSSTSASSTSTSATITSSATSSASKTSSNSASSTSTSATITSSATSSASKTSSTSTSTTSTSATITPSTTSSASKTSSTSSTTSTSTTSSTSAASTPFLISTKDNVYSFVNSGVNSPITFVNDVPTATRFQINTAGYLAIYSGSSAGYLASMPKGANVQQALTFNPAGTASNNYVKCALNESQGWLECNTNGVGQYAYVCSSDGWTNMYFGPSIPSTCNWVPLLRNTVAA